MVGYYLGDSSHSASQPVNATLVINPAAPSISALNTLASFDGKSHPASVSASGPQGQNESSQLQISYKNLADSSVSTAAPTAVGQYEILASFTANRDFTAISNQDTGKTVTISTIFGAPTVVSGNTSLLGGLVADINGDGKPDLITENLNASGQSLVVYLGNGDGTFQAAKTTAIPFTGGKFMVLSNYVLQHEAIAIDLNGDGKQDLVIAADPYGGTAGGNRYGLYVILGNGDGTFQTATVGTADFPQIISLVTGKFLTGNNNPSFAYGEWTDPASTTYLNKINVGFGYGGGNFHNDEFAVGVAPKGLAAGDFNNDGVQDLVVSDNGGTGIMLSHGDRTFGAETYFTTKSTAQLAVADFNKDGNQDVLLSDNSGVYLFLGNGDGTFKPATTVFQAVPSSITSPVILGDYNGDGITDFATFSTTGFSASSFQVYYGNGDGTFAPALNYPITTTALFAVDLNNDGVTDLVQYDNSGDINVLLNTAPELRPPSTSPEALLPLTGNLMPPR